MDPKLESIRDEDIETRHAGAGPVSARRADDADTADADETDAYDDADADDADADDADADDADDDDDSDAR